MTKTIKKLSSLILVVTILATIFIVPAYAATQASTQTGGTKGIWKYILSGGKATNVHCTSELSGSITIPSALDGYPVVSIKGDSSIYSMYTMFNSFSNDTITSVIIPDSVTSIGDYAFYLCRGLTSVTMPNSVTSIGMKAFFNCENLTSITISDSVTSIYNSAFYGCSSLTSITIPDSVTTIGTSAFYGCTSLTSITIPDSVTSIYKSAFAHCPGSPANKTIIPKNISLIQPYAFTNMQGVYYYRSNPVAQAASTAYTGIYAWTALEEENPPVITIAPYNINPTNQNITVNATTDKGTLNATNHTFAENGSFEFIATDEAGNVATKTVTITNIDKIAPSNPIISINPEVPTNSNVDVIIQYSEDSDIKQYNINDGEWLTYIIPFEVSENSIINARAYDVAGNVSVISTYNITNIDKDAPTAPVILIDDSVYYQRTITINYDETDTKMVMYKIGETGEWVEYTEPFVIDDNQTFYAKSIDWANNEAMIEETIISIIPENSTVLRGDILPIIITFTIPTNIEFTINPGKIIASERFITPEFTITNNSNAPLIVEISEFKAKDDSPYRFAEDVLPSVHNENEWFNLNTDLSMRQIALGVKPISAVEWGELNQTETLYVAQMSDSTRFGILSPQSSVTLTLTAFHGNAFDSEITANYTISWVFGLKD